MPIRLRNSTGPALVALRDRISSRDSTLDAASSPPDVGLALPDPPNPLVGRERELDELGTLLDRRDARLVSLTGAGGSGKSRLALELARRTAPDFANGVAIVELASLDDPSLVLPTVARLLGIDAGSDALDALAAALAQREILLVLDNIEHLRAEIGRAHV